MKKAKQLLSLILSVVMLFSITVGIDLSSYADTSGDFEYEILDDGTAEIIGYTGNDKELTIPSTFAGYKVTSIGEYAFLWCEELTSVVIPDSVTSIGEDAFAYCKKLADITIPKSVKTIGGSAFIRCESLENIILPDGITTVEGNTFFCCSNLKNITIPNSVTSIEYCAFFGCENLTDITIPNSITSIDNQVFNGCEKLTDINVDKNNKNYLSVDGVLYNENKTELIRYPEGKNASSFTIPNTVTSIDNSAFCGCVNLTNVAIPGSVSNIGDGAFCGCENLTDITIPEKAEQISYYTFSGCKHLTNINADENNKSYTSADGVLYNKNKTELAICPAGKSGSFQISDTVTSIGDGAFDGCDKLTEITIPTSVTSIGGGAFGGCKSLTQITIPKNIKQIGDLAFYDCTELKNITILSEDVVIGYLAFGFIHDVNTVYGDFEGGLSELNLEGCKIYGYKNSTAEKYAEDNGIEFIAIETTTTAPTTVPTVSTTNAPANTASTIQPTTQAQQETTTKKATTAKPVSIKVSGTVYKLDKNGDYVSSKVKKPSISKTTKAKKSFKTAWKKISAVSGYQVQYSTSKKFTKKTTKTKTIEGNKSKKPSLTVKKLKSKKTYYVRVRTYKNVKVNGKTTKVYSSWSKVKSVKTK